MQKTGFTQVLIGVVVAVIALGIGGYVLLSQRNAFLPEPVRRDEKQEIAEEPPREEPRQESPDTSQPAPSKEHRTTPEPLPDPTLFRSPTPRPAVTPPTPAARSGFQDLKQEISVLSQTGRPIGPEHYSRLQQRINQEAAAGADPTEIQSIKNALEPLNPAAIPSLSTGARKEFRKDPEIPTQVETATLPDCAGKRYAVAPVERLKIREISPLGNLGPPGHTFPTEHMFFHISSGGETTETIPLSSPADIHLTLISSSRGATQDPIDYTLWFALCKDVIGYYNHVKELSPELEKIVSESQCFFPGESKETRCNIQTLTPIASGALMGRVGRLQGNFDFGTFDLSKTLAFANPGRYGTRTLHIQCAFDYYGEPLKQELFSLMNRSDKQCGITAQDVPGTLKGNWFFGASRADTGSDWDKHLGFLQDSGDPGLSVISIGGTLTSAGKWEFRAQSSGFVNRSFAEVRPDRYIYCYEATKQSGRILVEMTAAAELKIERQEKPCSENIAFVNPILYAR